jgi:uncharacterized membrane protein HdeD (DUF308 family)
MSGATPDLIEPRPGNQGAWGTARGVAVLVMGALAVLSPFFAGALATLLVGLLLIACGALEMLETFYADREAERRSVYLSGALSVLAGGCLLARPLLLRGLALLIAASFLVAGVGKAVAGLRARGAGGPWRWQVVSGLVNLGLALVLVAQWPVSGRAVVAVLVGVRMLGVGWSLLLGRAQKPRPFSVSPPRGSHPDRRLGLPPNPQIAAFEDSLAADEANQRRVNAVWCWTFVAVSFPPEPFR